MFPPGRARLAMRPIPTGSQPPAITMGVVVVALAAVRVAVHPKRHDDIHLETEQCAARSGSRSDFPPQSGIP